MGSGEVIVAIVFIAVIGSVISKILKAYGHHSEWKAARDGALQEADELRDLIATLEERIRVLERIVTDTSNRDDLRRQFRDLEHGR
jgi:type II secretory pathway component PulJ